MRRRKYVDRDDQLFARQVVIAMIQSGTIRLPDVDMVSGTPEETSLAISKAVTECLMAADEAVKRLNHLVEVGLGDTTADAPSCVGDPTSCGGC